MFKIPSTYETLFIKLFFLVFVYNSFSVAFFGVFKKKSYGKKFPLIWKASGKSNNFECVKSVRIRSYSGPYFAAFGAE